MLISPASRMAGVQKSIIRQIFEAAQGKAINLGLGEIQFDTPLIIRELAAKVAGTENCRYTLNAGTLELRRQIAAYYEQKVNVEGICVTCGAAEALHSCFTSYVNPGDEVMIADPTFLAYEASIRINGGTVVRYRLDPEHDFALDREDFRSKISSKTKIVMICNPSNPLSKCLSIEELEFMAEECRKHGSLIISDEIYRELTYIERQPSMLDIYDDTIIVSGISKSHCMTGWRIGWAASSNADYIKTIVVAHQYQSTCAPYISQRAAELAMSEKGLATISEIKSQLVANRDFIISYFQKNLPELEYLKPDAAPYLFINVKGCDKEFSRKAAAEGVIVIPGSAFGPGSTGWIRISYALNRELLSRALTILVKLLTQVSQLRFEL
ncbi:MAG: pyridoxal phosphate-dependent aminotransferase [Candidatus Cloacimonetes bacterium]|nr:pyridoxal phosphate-dependent aminotransferase [Candidatus Cloacimonadota bacterium]